MNETFENEFYSRRLISRLALGMLAGALIIQAAAAIISVIIYRFDYSVALDKDANVIISAVCVYLVGMPIIYLALRNMRHVHPHKNRISAGQFFKLFAASYALAYVSNLFGTAVISLLSAIKGSPIENRVFDTVMDTNIVTEIIFMVILAPMMEELIFRKLIIDRTLIMGDRTAIFISALIFGLFHGNFSQFVYAFSLGLIFGYVYIRTGNILITMGLHGLMNFFGSVVASTLLKNIDIDRLLDVYSGGDVEQILTFFGENSLGMIILSIYGMIIFAMIILGIIFLFSNIRRLTLYEGEIMIPRERFTKTVFLNLGMVLFILYFFVVIILQILE